jgi:hypothetical protein
LCLRNLPYVVAYQRRLALDLGHLWLVYQLIKITSGYESKERMAASQQPFQQFFMRIGTMELSHWQKDGQLGRSANTCWVATASCSSVYPVVRPGTQAFKPSMSIISRCLGSS